MSCARCNQSRPVPSTPSIPVPMPIPVPPTPSVPSIPSTPSWSGNLQTDLMFEIQNIRLNAQSNCCIPSRELYMASRESACCPSPYYCCDTMNLQVQQMLNLKRQQCCNLQHSLPQPMSYDYYMAKRNLGF